MADGKSLKTGAIDPTENQRRPSDAELATIARTYCANIAATASESRLARDREILRTLEAEIEKKSTALEKLIEDARGWTERRDKLISSARDGLVETYSKMRPEAAAQQLAAMSDDVAMSIMTKLAARSASAILNEMGPEKAARLADSALRKGADGRDKGGS